MIYIAILILLALVANALLLFKLLTKKVEPVEIKVPPSQPIDTSYLIPIINDIPNKVLQSLKGSSNTMKGALGEFMGYMKLQSTYDRVIPLGNVVDFLCISLPKEGDEGSVDFIDIKTDKARLTKEQRLIRELIDKKKIKFIKLSYHMDNNPNEDTLKGT